MILTQKEADEWKFPLVVLFRPEMAPDSIYFFLVGEGPYPSSLEQFLCSFLQAVHRLMMTRLLIDDAVFASAHLHIFIFRVWIPDISTISFIFFWANSAYSELNVALFFVGELLRYMDHPQWESNQVSLELFRSRNIILTFETIRLKDSRHPKWRRQYY